MDKQPYRSQILRDRRAMGAPARSSAAAEIAGHVLASPEVVALQPGDLVAAYVSFGSEPATGELISRLVERGLRIIVPITLADRSLDWREVSDPALGMNATAALGIDAIGSATFVVVPALACATDGTRLGRGGGSYDRALTLVAPGVPVCALLYDDELVAELPREPRDRPVTMAALPGGVVRFGR